MKRIADLPIVVMAVIVLAAGSWARGEGEVDFEKLAAEKAPALVTVKFVLQFKGSSGEGEDEREVTGVMIRPDGLVLCSNSQFGGGPMVRPGTSVTPRDIKVLLGDETQGLEARLVARDSELDLTWIRIKEPGERVFPFIDLEKSATPKLGDRLYTIIRLGRYFDRATVVRELRVGGFARKPRNLYIPSQALAGPGLPVFVASGEFAGVAVLQLPDAEEIAATGSMSAFVGSQGLILPAGEVSKATRRALEADDGTEGGRPSASERSVADD